MAAQKDTGERSFTLHDLRGETSGWARLADAANDLRFVPLDVDEDAESPNDFFDRIEAEEAKAKK